MILGLVALGSFVLCLIAFVAVLVAGGPWLWLGFTLFATWSGVRVWRWLSEPIPIDAVDGLLPSRNGP